MDGMPPISGTQVESVTPPNNFRGKITVDGFEINYNKAFLDKHGIEDSQMEQFVKPLLPQLREVSKLPGLQSFEVAPHPGTREEKYTITYLKNKRTITYSGNPNEKIADLNKKLKDDKLSPEQKEPLNIKKKWYEGLQELQSAFNDRFAEFQKEVKKTRASLEPGRTTLLREKPKERPEDILTKEEVERESEGV